MLHILSFALLPILLTIAATSDAMTYRIPNWLTLLTAALFFPMALATGLPLALYAWHLLAALLIFALGYTLFAFNLMGAGDVKLMTATGLWFGITNLMSFIQVTAYAGLIQICFMLVWSFVMLNAELSGSDTRLAGFWARLKPMTPNVPFGFAIALGGIVAFRDTWWLHGLQ